MTDELELLHTILKKLDENSEDIASLKRSLVIIEDAVTNKIPALFDANLVNQEKH